MSETTKTFVFPDCMGGSNSGIDPNTLLAMMNNNGGFGGGNNWMWVIFLFFLYGWGGNGFFGRNGLNGGVANEVNNDYGRSMLLEAINGNGNALNNLATQMNCSTSLVLNAINGVLNTLCGLGNTMNMSTQSVINALNQGNQTILSQLCDCCCNTKLLITQSNYENQIATLNQTNQLGSKIDQQTTFLSDKFCALEKRELLNKIDNLTATNTALQNSISNANQTNLILNYINGLVSPLVSEISSIKNALPNTVSVPYPQVTAVPTYIANSLNGYSGNVWA